MKATLIIANYNGRELLAGSLPALVSAAGPAGHHTVVVADDGSTDDSLEFVHTTHPRVRTLALPRAGFGATCNAAVAAAETEAVVLLNSDVLVSPGFLEPLLSHLDDPDVFAVGAKFVNPDGTLTDTLGNRTSGRWHQGLLHIDHETDPERLAAACPQLYAHGALMAFRRDKWLQLGGFDPLYRPFYWEDTDLGYRAWGRGWKVLFEPASAVVHVQGSTIGRFHRPAHVELMSAKNAVLFSWKNLLEPGMFRRVLAAQVRWAADDVLIGGLPPRTAALFGALRQLAEAGRRRAQEQRERARSDQAILERASGGPQ
jgi:GT2 family glycosyltransferase